MATASTDHDLRLDRLARELTVAGVDVFLANSPITLAYLQGLHESGGERFLALAISRDGRTRMICPSLTVNQAGRCGVEDIRAWRDGEYPMALVRQLADDWALRSAVFAIDDDMRASHLLELQETLPAALFRPGQRILAALMRCKDAKELELLRTAGAIADEAFPGVLAKIRDKRTELEVGRALSSEMQRLGGTPTFAIVATGANSAEPHHSGDDTAIREGDIVVLDFGCDVGGYQSDITRTVCCGSASDEMKTVYRVVYDAHMAARNAIHPGVPAQDVDRAARRVIEEAGFGEFFLHRTGHGLGTRIHEDPYIVEGNTTPLEVGNCFSIEPGIYLPGRFGVRIENIVTVTESGHSSFNAEPAPELLEVR